MTLVQRNVVAGMVMAVAVLMLATALSAVEFDNWKAVRNVAVAAPGAHPTFNTAASEGCPAVSRDGLSMFIASNRDGTLDIWRARRESAQQPWGAPEKLPAIINKPDSNEFCPTPLSDGQTLLFVSNKAGGCGAGDIYITADYFGLGWQEPTHLPCSVNSSGDEASPFLVD
ncbi:MAG: hypothetical protein ABL982_24605, partial [Vicinamibacterales bacterium]